MSENTTGRALVPLENILLPWVTTKDEAASQRISTPGLMVKTALLVTTYTPLNI